jgi:aminopeptidase YwaD
MPGLSPALHGRGGTVKKKIFVMAMIAGGMLAGVALGQKPPLLPEGDVAALANELSGETAKRNLEVIATFHRQRGSRGFHSAAELVAERAREYGLSDVQILEFPADGKIFYGTQRSRPAWDAEVGELWELAGSGELRVPGGEKGKSSPASVPAATPAQAPICDKERVVDGKLVFNTECSWPGEKKIASYAAEPVVLAEDSESADVTAELVDVGEGTKESDYVGKDVKGKIVLVSASPGAVQDLAVGRFGVVGIVSYAQNQRTAWWGGDENLIRWGHLETFSEHKTFAFMVSLKTARGMRERLARGEKITLHAVVNAGQHAGNYEVVTATIPGADPKLKEEEIAFSCHLDHQRPGANDNASGCATILEVARTLAKLTQQRAVGGCTEPTTKPAANTEQEKKYAEWKKDCDFLAGAETLARPARTIRFIFPPEIEGTLALLNARPDLAKRIKAVIHMDMVGGGPATEAVFHVTRGPMSLPSFVHDVAWAFAEFVNEESYKFAATGKAEYPFVAPEGGKEPLRAEYSAYTMGSDHDVYQDSSFGIPAIYMNDWPDRYIHTNFDTAANIDTTKLKRAAFIGAASGYFLAGMNENGAKMVLSMIDSDRLLRAHLAELHAAAVSQGEASSLIRTYLNGEIDTLSSTRQLVPSSITQKELAFERLYPIQSLANRVGPAVAAAGDGLLKFKRSAQPKGPLAVFGYDYFGDHAKAAGVATPKLFGYEGFWGGGEEYAYEVLNFADGKKNAQEILDAVSAEYGPVPLEVVVEYLRGLEKIGLVAEVK